MAADSASHVVVDALVLLFIVGLFLATTRINYLVYVAGPLMQFSLVH